jgi:hypothetical protein
LRTANTKTADSILLVFLIICLSFLLWFLIGGIHKKNPLDPISDNDTEQIIEEPEITKPLNLEDAVQELKQEGCQLVSVGTRVYLDNPQYIDYEEFKSKALETRLVILTLGDSGIILLVQIKNDQWVWIPS